MAGFRSSRERAPGAGVRNSVSLPCPLSERPKTDAAIFTVQKLFGTFLHKKVREKENRAASRSQRFWGEQILSVAKNDLVLDSSSVLRPPQNDRERAPQNDGQGLGMTVVVLFRLLRRCAPRNDRQHFTRSPARAYGATAPAGPASDCRIFLVEHSEPTLRMTEEKRSE